MGWRRATFKDKDVWVEVTGEGAPVVRGRRVPIRYSDAEGAKVYGGSPGNVGEPTGPTVDLPDGVSADAAKKAKKSRRASGFGSAGTRTKAQAAAAKEAASELVASLPEGTAVAYTDGGCKGNPGPAGSGVRLELPDGRAAEASVSLGVATNNVAELTAVLRACELLDEAGWPADGPVAVLTDSQYTNGVVALGWKVKANKELVASVKAALAARPGVVLHWVAGHAGVPGNERADALAGDGVGGVSATVWTEAP